jgi:vacuolar-type H+-ATPase catalytic subunit A/Vma1
VLPKGEADIAAWAKKYPDVAAIVEAIADKKATERSKDLDNRLKEIEELRTQAKKDKAEAELMSLHPDFTQIRSDDAFHDWAESQPKWVQDALYENVDDAKSVARVIDLYKADMGITKQKTTSSDKAAASSVNARSRNTPEADDSKAFFRESQVNKMSTKDYEKNADAIMEAIRSGKFVYDVTGRK